MATTTMGALKGALVEHLRSAPNRELLNRGPEAERVYMTQLHEWVQTRNSFILIIQVLAANEFLSDIPDEDLYPEAGFTG